MSTDLFKRVLFSDGEGLDTTDLNGLTETIEAKIWDQIIHGTIGSIGTSTPTARDPEFGYQDGADHPGTYAICLNPGAATLLQGSSGTKVKITNGTLLQKTGNADGATPKILAYTFTGAEEWTIAPGATNWRVDLLQMKLELVDGGATSRDFQDAVSRAITTTTPNKTRRVQCTLTVKQGTAAASPTIPEPDAGFCVVGTVIVGATWTTGISVGSEPAAAFTNTATVHDQRMPPRIRVIEVEPVLMKGMTAWALSAQNQVMLSSSATNELLIPIPPTNGRLIGFSIDRNNTGTQWAGGGTIVIAPATGSQIAGSTLTLNGPITPLTLGGSGFTSIMYNRVAIEAAHAPSSGVVQVQSATSKISPPIWVGHGANGRAMFDTNRAIGGGAVFVQFKANLRLSNITPSGSQVLGARFYIAEGL